MQDVTFANCLLTQKHMWALHFFTKFSMTFYFQLKRSLQDLSRSLYLLLSKLSMLARWNSFFLVGERMLHKESEKFFSRKTEEKKFHITSYQYLTLFYFYFNSLHCCNSFTFMHVLISFLNKGDTNDYFSGSSKHFVFTAGSCWCWCWPGKSILATMARICLLLVGRDGWSCLHVNFPP